MTLRSRSALAIIVVSAIAAAPTALAAQKAAKPSAAATAPMPIVGSWTGKATVQLGDSTIIVPVMYTFVQAGAAVAGTATVPGQGTGPISNVVRDGTHIQFRVTAPENRLLEHDATIAADGTMEGMVHYNNKPVAKFKIAPKK